MNDIGGKPISESLLKKLVCPESMQSLFVADPALIETLNSRIATGAQRNQAGTLISERLTAALIREDRKVAYPLRDGIPVLLWEESLPL